MADKPVTMDDFLAPLSDTPSLEGLSSDERVDAMVEWWNENFEDPAQAMPYDGREGGFQYIHGGPYEASDYIHDYFPDATDDEQQEAVDIIDGDGPEYAPAGIRVLPPEDDDYQGPQSLEEMLANLAAEMATVRSHVEQIRKLHEQGVGPSQGEPGIGHNGAPDEFKIELDQVTESIEQVRVELAKVDPLEADQAVLEVAKSRFAKFRDWIKELIPKAPMMIASGVLGGVGKLAFDYLVEHHEAIAGSLGMAVSQIGVWVSHLTGVI